MSQIESMPNIHENNEIKVISGNYGKCYIEDCISHMQKIPDKSFDIVFTDTLWGHDYQKNAQKPMGINSKAKKQNRTPYMDKWNPEFHKNWFYEAQRISNAQIVCVGRLHKYDWIQMFKPIWETQVYYKNGQGSTQTSQYSAHMPYLIFGDELWIFDHLPYLCYGDDEFWKKKKFYRDVYETYIHNGFLRDSEDVYKNPSPKDTETWLKMIGDLKPKSVFDPFFGSGTTGEVCEILGIPWEGTELNLSDKNEPAGYDNDIKYRIKRGMKAKNLKLNYLLKDGIQK